jgi:uncharacterized protein YyaL (SSP411 family)
VNPRLAESASPYLRSHAGNPVAWHAWGEEAFAEARRRNVPVFVSIGYSTCHWCHVMARESFEDAALAERLNEHFVAIKVDREEHPEVDAAYMAAAGAFTQHLGWPLSVFTTPEGGPFYAGTYFPPEPRGGMPSFSQVLEAVEEAWAHRRTHAEGTAAAIAEALRDVRASAARGAANAVPPTAEAIVEAAGALAAREDPQFGGFWGGDPAAPKFPVATALRLLQARLIRERAPEASAVADRALAAMAGSELRDPVEGGFFRYATRRDWTVPHYERMLTDNAQLLDVALDAGDEDTARGIASFLIAVLQRPGGGFGAAQDSESWIGGERSEGGYYQRDAVARRDLEPPAVDGKVVTGWNGLAIGALARAGARLGEPGWVDATRRAADAVLAVNTTSAGRLVRASLDGTASRAPATVADHGQLADGLISLAVATGEPAYAVQARGLVAACLGDDGDLRAPAGMDPVLAAGGVIAPDAATDGDEPSGVAAIAGAAVALWLLGGGEEHRALAERLVAEHAAAGALEQPLAHAALLRSAAILAIPPRQVVVVADDPADPLARVARGLPAEVVAVVTPAQAAAWADAGFELFAEKHQREGRPTAYDCRDFACRLPTTDAADLI